MILDRPIKMDVSSIIAAMSQLVSSDRDSSTPVDWTERLLYNMKKVKDLLLHFPIAERTRSELLNPAPHDPLWEFVAEGLTLLVCLHNTLCAIPPSDDMHKLLSMSDQKTLRSLTQFVSMLGLYRYLDTGVGIGVANSTVSKLTDICTNKRITSLYKCLKVILECVYNDSLTSTMLPVSLPNVLAALLLIIYKPISDSSTLHKDKRDWCHTQLQYLLDHVSQPLVVHELLLLQGMSSRKGDLLWLQRACGELLSQQLMKRNGIQYVLRGIFEGGGVMSEQSSENWRKCQSVAKVISNCPLQAVSTENYYSLICPQILSLFDLPHDGIGQQFLRVAVITISTMLHKHNKLTAKYLINSLLDPLRKLTGEEDCVKLNTLPADFKNCLTNLNRILTTIEPTSPLLPIIASYLPVVFEIWRTVKKNELSLIKIQCKELIVSVMKLSGVTVQLDFFNHLLHIDSSTEIHFKCVLEKLELRLTDTVEEFSAIEDTTIASGKFNSQVMEELGSSIIDLSLDKELKSIVGNLFVSLLKHFSSVLAVESGLEKPKREEHCNSDGASSSILLDWEHESTMQSDSVSFSNALVLFVLASLCENMDGQDLQMLDKGSTIESVSKIIKCHSLSCKEAIKDLIVRENCKESLIDKLTGGRVSLSIAFGLLSAHLTNNKQIERAFRPVLADMLPHLESIVHYYPDEELSSLAIDLKVCISTLGAVWSEEMKEKAQKFTKQKPKTTSSQSFTSPLIEEIASADETKDEDGPSLFNQALRDLQDPSLPVQSHGIKQLSSLIRSKDKETVRHSKKLMEIFTKSLHHSDSYIYLPAIQGLVALASIEPNLALPLLCSKYAQFSEEKVNEEFDQTGKYTQKMPKTKKIDDANSSSSNSLEWRIKIGEALVQIVQECGDLLPQYIEPILGAVLFNVHHDEPLVRSSALSNLASICKLMKWSFSSIENEVIRCIEDVLKCEPDPTVRRGAINIIKELFEGLGTQIDKVLKGESLLVLYRVLKTTESSDPDHLTRTHAQSALGELDSVMRELLFPKQSLTKKISVLDHM